MKKDLKNPVKRATRLFWLLLIYVVAALVWWFVALELQNRQMYSLSYTI